MGSNALKGCTVNTHKILWTRNSPHCISSLLYHTRIKSCTSSMSLVREVASSYLVELTSITLWLSSSVRSTAREATRKWSHRTSTTANCGSPLDTGSTILWVTRGIGEMWRTCSSSAGCGALVGVASPVALLWQVKKVHGQQRSGRSCWATRSLLIICQITNKIHNVDILR